MNVKAIIAASLHFSAGGEAKWMRDASVRGTRRLAPHLLNEEAYLDSTVSTASKRNEVMADLSSASTVSW